MATFLHTMVRVTDPEKSRAFYEALGFEFAGDFDIVRMGKLHVPESLHAPPGRNA